MNDKKIIVCCPGDVVSGGPELLHQFVACLIKNQQDASILYHPFDKVFAVPSVYANYQVKIAKLTDVTSDSIVVIPETATAMLKTLPKAHICVWWLSVDNFFGYKGINPFREKLLSLKRIVRGKRCSLHSMRKFTHLSQSQYASDFLGKHNIPSLMVTDYLNQAHLNRVDSNIPREKIIAYNPLKGFNITSALIRRFPELEFVPIRNMTPDEVSKLLQRSMIYMDFGLHPGKDRFPREAAMAGCCIITGRRGSAANTIDVPIPSRFKIDERDFDFELRVGALIDEIFSNYDTVKTCFDSYRELIKAEPTLFNNQVVHFINSLS